MIVVPGVDAVGAGVVLLPSLFASPSATVVVVSASSSVSGWLVADVVVVASPMRVIGGNICPYRPI